MWTRRNVAQLGIALVAGPAGAGISRPSGPKIAGVRFHELSRRVASPAAVVPDAGAGVASRTLSSGPTPAAERRYLLIHGDEETARKVLTEHMSDKGNGFGVAYIIDNPTRTIPLRGGKLDPNRMFSNIGAEANLKKLNPAWTQKQVDEGVKYLNSHRNQLVNKLIPPRGGLIVALHNNSKGYDINVEIPISDSHSLNDPSNPGDFGLCSDARDYALLKDGPYNVVLEANPRGTDDGSLSRLAVKLGVRYVNLEAKLGNFDKQKAMLNWVESRLA